MDTVGELKITMRGIEEEYTRIVLGFEPKEFKGKGAFGYDTFALVNEEHNLRMRSGEVLAIRDTDGMYSSRSTADEASRVDCYRIADNWQEAVVEGMNYSFTGTEWVAKLADIYVKASVSDYGFNDAFKAVVIASKIIHFQKPPPVVVRSTHYYGYQNKALTSGASGSTISVTSTDDTKQDDEVSL